MAKPALTTSHSDALPPSRSTRRGIRWLLSGLLLLLLAFVFHTSGHWAHVIQNQARRWLTTTTTLPVKPHAPAKASASPSQAASHPVVQGWSAPVVEANLVSGFGWHGRGSHAQFQSDVVLEVPSHVRVSAGMKGRVTAISGQAVDVQSGGYTVEMAGVSAAEHLALHQSVTPQTLLGTARGTKLTITVKRDGIPVNPLLPELYGARWTHRG